MSTIPETNEKPTYDDGTPRWIPAVTGAPVKYETVEELQEAINRYFKSCWKLITTTKGTGELAKTTEEWVQYKSYTSTGLALSLGMTRKGLIEYQHKDSHFGNAVTRAKQLCEEYAEGMCFVGKNPTGAMFVMKNCYEGWEDKKSLDINEIHTIPAEQLEAMKEQIIQRELAKRLPDPDTQEAEIIDGETQDVVVDPDSGSPAHDGQA